MCGIVGLGGNLYQKDLQALETLLWADAVRGFHSTGLATVTGAWATRKMKAVGSPMNLFCKTGYNDLLSCSHRLYIGHNRHATIGEVSEDNAHPFEFQHVIGVHNGTLRGRSDDALVGRKKFGTDSETLYHNIDEFGVEDIIPEIEGAWALAWYNKTERTLNFLRNNERPLHYAFSKDGKNIYWASESGMLRWVLNRHGVELASTGIMSLNSDTWVRWEMPKNFSEAWGEPEIKELKGYSAPFFQTPNQRIHQQGEMFNGWTPQPLMNLPSVGESEPLKLGPPTIGPGTRTASPAVPSGNGSSKKSSPVKQLNVNAGSSASPKKVDPLTGATLPGLPNTRQPSTNEKHPFLLGKAAGRMGRSAAACPFSGGPKRQAWLNGRLDGIEEMAHGLNESNVRVFAIEGFNGERMTEGEWKRRTGQTCSCCDQIQDFNTMSDAHWVAADTFYCDDCVEQTKFSAEILREAV